MTKVCILTSAHFAFDERIFYKEAKTLVKAEYIVTLIAQHNKNEEVEGIKIVALSKPYNRLQRMTSTVFHILRLALKEKAKVYHFHDPELIPVGLFLKISTKAKIIYDVHEDYRAKILSKNWIITCFRKPVAIGFTIYEKLSSRMLDHIIVTDNVVYLKLKPFLNNKVSKVGNFPSIYNFNQVRNRDKEKEEIFTCIYIGGLSEDRGLFKMVEALKLIDYPTKLILLGEFENEKDLNKLKNMEGFKKVDYIGQKSWHEAISFLTISDVGLVLLQPVPAYEYAGENTIKLFEYMIARLPVISSNFPNLRKIIEENKSGICVNPMSPKEISKAVEYLIEHPDEASQMGESGRKAVLEKYNWENESKKLLEIYEEL